MMARFALARRRLALRAKIAASSRNDDAPDRCAAPIARLPFSSVSSMMALIFSRLAVGVKKIRNGRAAHDDGAIQNILQHSAQCLGFLQAQLRANARRA